MESVQKAVRDAAEGLRNLTFGQQQVTESAAQHGEEPVSGVQGRGTPTDPYDAGNRDEQPGAPQTQDNTAVIPEPLESITPIEVKPTDVSSAQSTSDQAAGDGAGTATALPVAPEPSPAPVQEESQSTTPNTNPEPGPGNPAVDEPAPAQEQSNPTESTADTVASSSTSSNHSESEKPAPEQRSQTMPEGDSSSGSQQKEDGGVPGGVERAAPTTTQNVSVEALKGPQGPPPRDAYEFEKEMDGKPSKTKTDQDDAEKSDTGNHHHKMGHMKERLGKVFKHGNR